ncbi:MAG TPA: hypothetical protein VGY55_11560, partial [Pirellulales bacterium]|nr:hypothetical protein [Pirellulales bacterium]
MAITPTYPGIYIQELPSSAHTVVAAPTSITVFIGYSHPYKTTNPGEAIELFSFTEFEALFGGLFTSGVFDSNLAYAVNQFFLNGGSTAYVIGLIGSAAQAITVPPLQIAPFQFTALEPVNPISLNVT